MGLGMARAFVGKVERLLDAYLASLDLGDGLKDAARYAVLGGGKRVRPMLVGACCRAAGGDEEHAVVPAAAVELVHSFSLVHDDLPALDDDDLRRGQPTLHIHAGEAMALLAGDLLLNLAFELLAGSVEDPRVAIRLCQELAKATSRMIDGQVYDTLGGLDPGLSVPERLEIIHARKTGALIEASCRMGAIAANADERTLAAITTYGRNIGIMFQIVDDLLDVEQSSQHTGKRTGKDAEAGKMTAPAVMGVQNARADVERLARAAVDAADALGSAGRELVEISDWLCLRTR